MKWSFKIVTGLSVLFSPNNFVQAVESGEGIHEKKSNFLRAEGKIETRMLRDGKKHEKEKEKKYRENDDLKHHYTDKSLLDLLRDTGIQNEMTQYDSTIHDSNKDAISEKEKAKAAQESTTPIGTGDNSSMFSPARPIEYFRDEIDETIFEWIDKDDVQANQTTCGFLYPKLGIASDEGFPTIKVKFCVKFAVEQPAPKGNLAVHCGGPGSLSNCHLGSNLLGYNIITLDQRGLGMSWPSFAHEECASQHSYLKREDFETEVRIYLEEQKNQAISCWGCKTCDFQLNSTKEDGKTFHFLEYSGTRQVAQDLDLFRQVIGAEKLSLYGVSYGTQVMATYATIYSDHTDKFVIDANMSPRPDLIHMATIDAEKVHRRLSYISYTCTILELNNPGSCSIDMNQCYNDVFSFYEELLGRPYIYVLSNVIQRIGVVDKEFREIIFAAFDPVCNAAASENESEFLYELTNLISWFDNTMCFYVYPDFFEELVKLLETEGVPPIRNISATPSTFAFEYLIFNNTLDDETCTSFYTVDDASSKETMVHDFWKQNIEPLYSSQAEDDTKQKHQMQAQYPTKCSGPTTNEDETLYVPCNDGNEEVAGSNRIETDLRDYEIVRDVIDGFSGNDEIYLVHAQSQSGSTYDDEYVIQKVKDIYREYGGSFYAESAVAIYLNDIAYGYFWPQAQPIPPSGNPTITGIVAGQLFDHATDYKDTQEMKMAFPSATLVTSQWVQHGLEGTERNFGETESSSDGSCQSIIDEYFETGIVPVVDGFVCGSSLPNPFEDF